MTAQNKKSLTLIVIFSIGILVYVGVVTWLPPSPPVPSTQAQADVQADQRLAKLEHAVMALTQTLQVKQTQDTRPEPAQATTAAAPELSRQDLAKLIRDEVRNAVAQESPEAQRAKEEAIAEAKILNSPENKAAYQSASSVVQTAVAAKRWTEEDRDTFNAAIGSLTTNQRTELMGKLIPAVNRGELKVEVNGPLF
ncbi:MAG: hypothetical protein FJ147_17155 [Deltaproteobacteria bacterium]|nr:hypothetical protein [Deltaproteobacteria bacterium]